MPDKEVARRLGCRLTSEEQQRRKLHIRSVNPEENAMLGKISDEELALLTGRPIGSVSNKRCQLGLAKPNAQRKYWGPEEILLLGTVPDREIAARLGRTLGSVKGERSLLGIRAFSAQPKP